MSKMYITLYMCDKGLCSYDMFAKSEKNKIARMWTKQKCGRFNAVPAYDIYLLTDIFMFCYGRKHLGLG